MGLVRDPPIVWIVDDDLSYRRAVTVLLRAHGFRVEAYAGAESLLPHVRAGGCVPAVLLLDVHLGPTSGLDLYDRLIALGVCAPAVFMTGRDDARTRACVGRLGATAYLVKPFDDAVLIEAVRGAMAAR